MTDAWCWGAWRFGAVKCGGGVRPLFDSRAPGRDGWRWCTDDGRGFHFWVCAGCFARENPHATGPHTRIVEEWEHEYGALCRVVAGPWLMTCNGHHPPQSVDILAEFDEAPEFAAIVYPLMGRPHFVPHHFHEVGVVDDDQLGRAAASAGEGMALAHADAERLALEWSPPIDEEAA